MWVVACGVLVHSAQFRSCTILAQSETLRWRGPAAQSATAIAFADTMQPPCSVAIAKMTPPSGGCPRTCRQGVARVANMSRDVANMSRTGRSQVAVCRAAVAGGSPRASRRRRGLSRGVAGVAGHLFCQNRDMCMHMYLDSHRRGSKIYRPAIRGNQHSAQLRQASLADEEVLWPVDVDFNLVKNTCAGVVLVVHAGL